MPLTPLKDEYYSYDGLMDTFGLERVVQVDDDDYQGDTRVIFKDGDRYGFLIFGWGSCSGCDALQGALEDGLKELTELRDQLHGSIRWEDEAINMIGYLSTKYWPGEYSWSADETKRFVKKAIEYLASELPW